MVAKALLSGCYDVLDGHSVFRLISSQFLCQTQHTEASLTHTDHGGSSSQRSAGALVEVICRSHAPVRHLEACVHINATWHHHTPMSIDGFHPTGNYQIFSNLPVSESEIQKMPYELYNLMNLNLISKAKFKGLFHYLIMCHVI